LAAWRAAEERHTSRHRRHTSGATEMNLDLKWRSLGDFTD
jgi:hypothetical protein